MVSAAAGRATGRKIPSNDPHRKWIERPVPHASTTSGNIGAGADGDRASQAAVAETA